MLNETAINAPIKYIKDNFHFLWDGLVCLHVPNHWYLAPHYYFFFAGTNGFAETYGVGSRCVLHGGEWTAGLIKVSPFGAGCYQVFLTELFVTFTLWLLLHPVFLLEQPSILVCAGKSL